MAAAGVWCDGCIVFNSVGRVVLRVFTFVVCGCFVVLVWFGDFRYSSWSLWFVALFGLLVGLLGCCLGWLVWLYSDWLLVLGSMFGCWWVFFVAISCCVFVGY